MTWTFERKLLAAAVLAWAVIAVMNLGWGPPLGHDEAAFAVVGRGVDGWIYRSRGLAAVARIGLALGGADWQMRLPSAVLGLGALLAVYTVGRTVFDARTGAWAAAVIAGAHPMVARNAELLSDLPAMAGVLFGVAILAHELMRPNGPRWRLALAAPAFAAAFYLRYGSVPVIAIAGAAALVLWWRAIVARPAPVLVTIALFVALLVPHFRDSTELTGSALGVLRFSSGVPRRAYWGEGLVTYLTSDPFVYYGAIVTPVLLVAFAGLARRLRTRGAWLLAIAAIGQVVAIGIESHGQPRYVFIAVALLVVLGVASIRQIIAPRITPIVAPHRLALAAVAAAWLAVAIAIIPYDRRVAAARASVVAAAIAIRLDHAAHPDAPCFVFASVVPQIMWYAACDGKPKHLFDRVHDLPGAPGARYLASTSYGAADGAAFAAAHGLTARELPTLHPRTRVWALH